jgi:hypothetical protein
MNRRFRPDAWDDKRKAAVDRAFREVPFYRDQWATAGRALAEPHPVRADTLDDELFRLCPLRSPWDPRHEPTLWIGDPRALADALAVAGVSRDPVLEVRRAVVDRTRLRRFGPRNGAVVDRTRLGRAGNGYGVLLAPDADVASDARRLALELGSLKLAMDHGRAVVVGSPAELGEIVPRADAALDGVGVEWTPVHRLTPAQAAGADHEHRVVVHDPHLGYLAATAPDCRGVHVLWRNVHVRATEHGLLFTRIRGRRPTLVNVLAADPGFADVGRCAVHGTPALTA